MRPNKQPETIRWPLVGAGMGCAGLLTVVCTGFFFQQTVSALGPSAFILQAVLGLISISALYYNLRLAWSRSSSRRTKQHYKLSNILYRMD